MKEKESFIKRINIKCPYCNSKNVYALPDEIRLCCIFGSCSSDKDIKTVKDLGDDILQEIRWKFKCKDCNKTFYLIYELSKIKKS